MTSSTKAIAQQEVAAAIWHWLHDPKGELIVGFTEFGTYAMVADGDDTGFIGACYDALLNLELNRALERARSSDVGNLDGRDLFIDLARESRRELASRRFDIVETSPGK